jgi:hypothetical protein
MRSRQPHRRALLLVAAAAVLFGAVHNGYAGEGEGQQARYEGNGATVVRAAGTTVIDEGDLTCSAATGTGTGGSCLRFDPFNPSPAIRILDVAHGASVAFQACIDNNGDSFCTSPEGGPCGDDIIFSHADGGAFFNPLAVPHNFRPGCPGGPFPGYVVFLCAGVHVDATAHTHDVTTGTATLVVGGTGSGNFCGGTAQRQSRKHYTITP